jgi:homoaconitate hydratase
MGTSAIGHITAAIVVAASSFSMNVTDPAPYLAEMDVEFYQRNKHISGTVLKPVMFAEPHVGPLVPSVKKEVGRISESQEELTPLGKINSKIVALGDFIDTDAVSYPLGLSPV